MVLETLTEKSSSHGNVSEIIDECDTPTAFITKNKSVRLFSSHITYQPEEHGEDSFDVVYSEDSSYTMSTQFRGKMLVFNEKNFSESSGLSNYSRRGTDKDATSISNLFAKFGFLVDRYDDIQKSEMINVLKAAAADSEKFSFFVCVILSHGETGIIYAHDGPIEIKQLSDQFVDSAWNGKPKFFIIQACQGDDFMDGIKVEDCVDGNLAQPSTFMIIPSQADFIFAYSTPPGFYSWRNTLDGSWFIQTLVKVFETEASKKDVVRMLTIVNDCISFRKSQTNDTESNSKHQVGCIITQLRKDFYLRPMNCKNVTVTKR